MTHREAIDPFLQETVIQLNEEGYETWFSCAGHPGRQHPIASFERGYISFKEKYPPAPILRILEENGLEDIRIGTHTGIWKPHTLVTFKALGGPSSSEEWAG